MTTKKLTVVLNISRLSVSEKIKKAGIITAAIAANPAVFSPLSAVLNNTNTALANLKVAELAAADGGRTKTAIMHDKERELEKVLTLLAHEIEKIANGDESIVHLAAMEIKQTGTPTRKEFEVFATDDRGAIGLRVKARAKTVYRWEYSLTGSAEDQWAIGLYTDVARATIGNLESHRTYWFRVVFISKHGEHASDAINFVVN